MLQSQVEHGFLSGEGNQTGRIFWAKNVLGWRDEKHLTVDDRKEYKIMLVLPPDSPIAKQLEAEEKKQITYSQDNP